MTPGERIARRTMWLATAPLVCLMVYWRAPITWFQDDDFAWLGLPMAADTWSGLRFALFHPAAQGTIRVLSERAFFLTFSWMFGLHAVPFHVWTMLTWFGALTLAALIGERLTGSRAAGLLAAVLWTTSPNLSAPLCWLSSYNEVLCALCLLLAFYARLRWIESSGMKWLALEWAAYLAGFGALETIVVYPALAALHALCMARKKFRGTLPLFIPSILFAAAHFFLIPKNPGDYYQIIVDWRLPQTLYGYVKWTLAPSHLGEWVRHGRRLGLATAAMAGAALLGFAWRRWKAGDPIGIFCIGWFFLLLTPVLALPNHIEKYYVTLPELGLAWLGGYGIVWGWQAGGSVRIGTLLLAVLFIGESIPGAERDAWWYWQRGERLRTLILGLRDATLAHPRYAFLLQGVDNDLFQSGFQDGAFRLIHADRVLLVPGSERGIQARDDLGGLSPFTISPSAALMMLERGQAEVFQVSKARLSDITTQYAEALRANPRATRHDFVDAGDPAYSAPARPDVVPGGKRLSLDAEDR